VVTIGPEFIRLVNGVSRDVFYLFLFLILGLVISPIIYLKPSPRQKQQMALRAKAHELGMQAKMAPMPKADAHEGDDASANAMAYRWLRPETAKRHMPVSYQVGRSASGSDEWFFFKQQRPPILLVEAIMPLLKQLPAKVEILESSGDFVCIYWHEAGSEDDVVCIAEILEQIHQQEAAFFLQ
jgi:hypothetical protein